MAITDTEFDYVAQNAHMLAGALAVCATDTLFGPDYMPYGILGMLLFAAIKEFWYDYKDETAEVRGSSLRDFAHYCIGIVVALALMSIKLYFWE